MENNAQKLDIDYMSSKTQARYFDEDVIVIDYLPKLQDNNIYKLDMLMCYGVIKGRLQFELNGNGYTISENDMVLALPNSYIKNCMMSPDLEVRVTGISYSVLQRHLNISKNYWSIIKYISINPVLHLTNEERGLFKLYSNLLHYKHENENKYYQKETQQMLLRCLFLEIAAIITPKLNEETEHGVLRHGEQLFNRFLELLSASEGRERSVKAYAERLCITPKYLSTLSKSTSGKTALSWIHKFTIDAIERRLKYSDKTIKEISDEMNFPNLSFFGKFTKCYLGKSPTEYRRNLNNE